MDQIRYQTHQNIPQNHGFNPPPQQSFNSPDMLGSVQKVLGNNVGQYVVMEFLIGTESIVRKQGILYFVGTDYVVLYDDVLENYIVCDLYAIKFTYFYYPGQRPTRNFNALTPIDFEGKQ
jgi:hypothetical protein